MPFNALLSVSDKTGLDSFARALVAEFGAKLISTGGTARFLRGLGLEVRDVSDLTGFPEMMDGRVKTLHPKVHGGLLALRDDPGHVASMKAHGIEAIDLVCVNLYPFATTVAKPGVGFAEAIENIDIGGPSMIRSAAKNHRSVTVVTDADQYDVVLADLRANGGRASAALRLELARAAFDHTAKYDAMIAGYMGKVCDGGAADGADGAGDAGDADSAGDADATLPQTLALSLSRKAVLRYGENPHQRGALYVAGKPTEASVAFAEQLHGKELSYINLFDADGALSAVKEFERPAACIVKHATPCGYAVADDSPTAFARAFAGDPLAAFGGIVALNRAVDLAAAEAITAVKVVLDVIVAPSFDADALELLRSRWKNTRILAVGAMGTIDRRETHWHRIVGGLLVQQRDVPQPDESAWKVATKRKPTDAEWTDLRFAWVACKHVKSNAVALARDSAMVGSGAGQQDRVNACRIAVAKAGDRASGSAAGSDAFFPFPDGPQVLLDAGIRAIIQPGGSLKDQLSIDAVDAAGGTMVFTGRRHFRH